MTAENGVDEGRRNFLKWAPTIFATVALGETKAEQIITPNQQGEIIRRTIAGVTRLPTQIDIWVPPNGHEVFVPTNADNTILIGELTSGHIMPLTEPINSGSKDTGYSIGPLELADEDTINKRKQMVQSFGVVVACDGHDRLLNPNILSERPEAYIRELINKYGLSAINWLFCYGLNIATETNELKSRREFLQFLRSSGIAITTSALTMNTKTEPYSGLDINTEGMSPDEVELYKRLRYFEEILVKLRDLSMAANMRSIGNLSGVTGIDNCQISMANGHLGIADKIADAEPSNQELEKLITTRIISVLEGIHQHTDIDDYQKLQKLGFELIMDKIISPCGPLIIRVSNRIGIQNIREAMSHENNKEPAFLILVKALKQVDKQWRGDSRLMKSFKAHFMLTYWNRYIDERDQANDNPCVVGLAGDQSNITSEVEFWGLKLRFSNNQIAEIGVGE